MTAQLDHGHEDTQLAKLELRLHADHTYHRLGRCASSALWTRRAPARRLRAPMQSSPDPQALLLVVDVQQGFDAPSGAGGTTLRWRARVAELLDAWRSSNRPVIHVKHMSTEPASPLRPDQPGNAFKVEAAPRPRRAGD